LKIQDGGGRHVAFWEKWVLDHSNPCVASIYQSTIFDKNTFFHEKDMAKNRKHNMAIAVILNFVKGEILLGYGNPCVGSIYQCIKCDIKDGGRRHLKLYQKWDIGPSNPLWLISTSVPNLTKISFSTTAIYGQKSKVQDGDRRYLEFCQR